MPAAPIDDSRWAASTARAYRGWWAPGVTARLGRLPSTMRLIALLLYGAGPAFEKIPRILPLQTLHLMFVAKRLLRRAHRACTFSFLARLSTRLL
jgi:hypothetical protein